MPDLTPSNLASELARIARDVHRMQSEPREGLDRCWCGSKYWDGDVCHSCGARFKTRFYADGRPESAPCEAGTVGCSIDHGLDSGECTSW